MGALGEMSAQHQASQEKCRMCTFVWNTLGIEPWTAVQKLGNAWQYSMF